MVFLYIEKEQNLTPHYLTPVQQHNSNRKAGRKKARFRGLVVT
jgi:hypothetical protein